MSRKVIMVSLFCLCFVQASVVSGTKNTELSLEQALHKIIANNLSAASLGYEIKQSDSAYERYQTKFSPFMSLSSGIQNTNLDPADLNAVYGSQFNKADASINLGQSFKTGTTVIGGYQESYTNYTVPGPYLAGHSTSWHSPAFYVQVKQDLLKNSFGYTDQLQNEILKNVSKSKQIAAEYQLSGLIVGCMIDYWTVAENQKKLASTERELTTYKKIYKAVEANVSMGLYDTYNLYQFNALIAGSEAKLSMVQLRNNMAIHKMLRNLNMQDVSENTLSLVSLDTSPHKYDKTSLLNVALEKRADIQNIRISIESAQKQLQILNNQDLPSLQFQLQATGLGYDQDYLKATQQALNFSHPNWETRFTAMKILDDKDTRTQRRDLEYKMAQANLQLQTLKNQIQDDVYEGVDSIQAAYTGYEKTKIMVDNTLLYMDALLTRLRQGKISTIELKNAVDMMVAANNAHAEAITYYNIALLNLDLVTNTLLEKYHIDINTLVKEPKL